MSSSSLKRCAAALNECSDEDLRRELKRRRNDEESEFRQLLDFCLDMLAREKLYRLLGDEEEPEPAQLYSKRFNSKGQFTQSFKLSMTLEEFLYLVVSPRESHVRMWGIMHGSAATIHRLVQTLTAIVDERFPHFTLNPSHIAFDDGYYSLHEQAFFPHAENRALRAHPSSAATSVGCQRYVHRSYTDSIGIGIGIGGGGAGAAGTTHHFQELLNEFGWSKKREWWLCVFLGRLLYPVNALDEWKLSLLMCGERSRDVFRYVREVMGLKYWATPNDGRKSDDGCVNLQLTGVLKSGHIVGFWSNADADFSLDAYMYRTMAEGSDATINRRHRIGVDVKWKWPAVFTSNKRGSAFDRITNAPPASHSARFDLPAKIESRWAWNQKRHESEFARVLLMLNDAYLKAVELYGKLDREDILSKIQESIDEDEN